VFNWTLIIDHIVSTIDIHDLKLFSDQYRSQLWLEWVICHNWTDYTQMAGVEALCTCLHFAI